jgi:hypothetical protein
VLLERKAIIERQLAVTTLDLLRTRQLADAERAAYSQELRAANQSEVSGADSEATQIHVGHADHLSIDKATS